MTETMKSRTAWCLMIALIAAGSAITFYHVAIANKDLLTGIIILLLPVSLLLSTSKNRKIKLLGLIPAGLMLLLTLLGVVLGI